MMITRYRIWWHHISNATRLGVLLSAIAIAVAIVRVTRIEQV